ncbi:MAG TPA: PQQ-binding-like beta-propeller repeat protein [Steroidobacteraceae bacterium]|jgi:outer membrane protein assembly factor BamB|nr:PQQ-binding-like beta-propeller repeat protein [Steroidobacteraceae bacterium]
MKYLVALFCACLSLPAVSQSSASFRGDAQHSGIYAQPGVPLLHGIKWKFKTEGAVISTPAVIDGTAYFGSNDHFLYAVNTADGAQRWKFKTGSRVASSPAVDQGRVYFGSYDGNIYSVDTKSGEQRWKFATEGERRFTGRHLHGNDPTGESMPDPFDFYLSSPTIVQDTLYIGSGDGNVYALDTATGALRWKFHTGNVVHASPAVANGTLYIGSWDSYFYALDAKSGQERWRFKTGEDHDIANQVGIQSSATIADGIVYFGCRDSNLYALDALTGAKKWAYPTKGSWVISTPIAKDGALYFTTSDSGLFLAVDAKSGVLKYSLSFHHWPMFSSPAIAGRNLYIGSNAGTVMAIDLDKHATAWTFSTDGARTNAAALTQKDGAPNYAAAFTDNFYDEMVIGVWKMLSIGAVLSSPVIERDMIYFGSTDGNVYAIS